MAKDKLITPKPVVAKGTKPAAELPVPSSGKQQINLFSAWGVKTPSAALTSVSSSAVVHLVDSHQHSANGIGLSLPLEILSSCSPQVSRDATTASNTSPIDVTNTPSIHHSVIDISTDVKVDKAATVSAWSNIFNQAKQQAAAAAGGSGIDGGHRATAIAQVWPNDKTWSAPDFPSSRANSPLFKERKKKTDFVQWNPQSSFLNNMEDESDILKVVNLIDDSPMSVNFAEILPKKSSLDLTEDIVNLDESALSLVSSFKPRIIVRPLPVSVSTVTTALHSIHWQRAISLISVLLGAKEEEVAKDLNVLSSDGMKAVFDLRSDLLSLDAAVESISDGGGQGQLSQSLTFTSSTSSSFSAADVGSSFVSLSMKTPARLLSENLVRDALLRCVTDDSSLSSFLSENISSTLSSASSMLTNTSKNAQYSVLASLDGLATLLPNVLNSCSGSFDSWWPVKYRPLFSNQVCGNSLPVSELRDWLARYREALALPEDEYLRLLKRQNEAAAAVEARSRDATNDDEEEEDEDEDDDEDDEEEDDDDEEEEDEDDGQRRKMKKRKKARTKTVGSALAALDCAAYIVGPSGSGKTAAVLACAAELGFGVIEVHPGQARDRATLISQLREATQSRRMRIPTGPSIADTLRLGGISSAFAAKHDASEVVEISSSGSKSAMTSKNSNDIQSAKRDGKSKSGAKRVRSTKETKKKSEEGKSVSSNKKRSSKKTRDKKKNRRRYIEDSDDDDDDDDDDLDEEEEEKDEGGGEDEEGEEGEEEEKGEEDDDEEVKVVSKKKSVLAPTPAPASAPAPAPAPPPTRTILSMFNITLKPVQPTQDLEPVETKSISKAALKRAKDAAAAAAPKPLSLLSMWGKVPTTTTSSSSSVILPKTTSTTVKSEIDLTGDGSLEEIQRVSTSDAAPVINSIEEEVDTHNPYEVTEEKVDPRQLTASILLRSKLDQMRLAQPDVLFADFGHNQNDSEIGLGLDIDIKLNASLLHKESSMTEPQTPVGIALRRDTATPLSNASSTVTSSGGSLRMSTAMAGADSRVVAETSSSTLILFECGDILLPSTSSSPASAKIENVIDKGFLQAVSDLAAEARCPIIITANGLPIGTPFSPLKGLSMRRLAFFRPKPSELVARLIAITLAEGITDVSPRQLMSLAIQCEFDIRQSIATLQFWKAKLPRQLVSSLPSRVTDAVKNASDRLISTIAASAALLDESWRQAIVGESGIQRMEGVDIDVPTCDANILPQNGSKASEEVSVNLIPISFSGTIDLTTSPTSDNKFVEIEKSTKEKTSTQEILKTSSSDVIMLSSPVIEDIFPISVSVEEVAASSVSNLPSIVSDVAVTVPMPEETNRGRPRRAAAIAADSRIKLAAQGLTVTSFADAKLVNTMYEDAAKSRPRNGAAKKLRGRLSGRGWNNDENDDENHSADDSELSKKKKKAALAQQNAKRLSEAGKQAAAQLAQVESAEKSAFRLVDAAILTLKPTSPSSTIMENTNVIGPSVYVACNAVLPDPHFMFNLASSTSTSTTNVHQTVAESYLRGISHVTSINSESTNDFSVISIEPNTLFANDFNLNNSGACPLVICGKGFRLLKNVIPNVTIAGISIPSTSIRVKSDTLLVARVELSHFSSLFSDAIEPTEKSLLPLVHIRAPRKPKDINAALMAGVDAYGSSESTIGVLVGDLTITLSSFRTSTLEREVFICEGNRTDIAGGSTDLRKSLGTLLFRAMKGDKRLTQLQPIKPKVVKSASKKRPRESDTVAVSVSLPMPAIEKASTGANGEDDFDDSIALFQIKEVSASGIEEKEAVLVEPQEVTEGVEITIDEGGGASADTVNTDPWTCIQTDNETMDEGDRTVLNFSEPTLDRNEQHILQELEIASVLADALTLCDLLSVAHGHGGTGVGPLLSSPSPAPALQFLLSWSDAGRAVNLVEETDMWRSQLRYPGPSQLSRLRMDLAGCDNVRLTPSITSGPFSLTGCSGDNYKSLLCSMSGTRNMLDYGSGEFEEGMEGGSGDVYDNDSEEEEEVQTGKRPQFGLSAFGFGPQKDSKDVIVLTGSSSGDEGGAGMTLVREPTFSIFGGGGKSRFDRARHEKQLAAAAAFNPEKDDTFTHSTSLHVSVSIASTLVLAEFAMEISTSLLTLSDKQGRKNNSTSISSSLESLFTLQALSTTMRHAASVRTTALLRQITPAVFLSARALSASSGHAPAISSCQGSGLTGGLSSGIDRMSCLRSLARSEVKAFSQYKKELAVAEAAAAEALLIAAAEDDSIFGSSTITSRRRSLRATSSRTVNKEIKKRIGPEPPEPHLGRIIEWINEDIPDRAFADILLKCFAKADD
jgi:hypothetical protein